MSTLLYMVWCLPVYLTHVLQHMFTRSLCVTVSLYIFMHMWTLCSLHLCVCSLGRKPLFCLIELNIRGFCNLFLSFHNFRTKKTTTPKPLLWWLKYLSSSFFRFLAQMLSRLTYWFQNLNYILPQTVHIRFARSY